MNIKPGFIWEDTMFGVIEAGELTTPDCPRSKTFSSLKDAMACPPGDVVVRPVLPGPKSRMNYVKVDKAVYMLYRSGALNGAVTPAAVPENKYPHKCPTCGGNMLVLFSTIDHEGGKCPGKQKAPRMKWS